jgi:predicted transcriptional regulator
MIDININPEDSLILSATDVSVTAKYLYSGLFILMAYNKTETIVMNIDDLSKFLGISKAKIYKARKELIGIGVLTFERVYCATRFKFVKDIYEIE